MNQAMRHFKVKFCPRCGKAWEAAHSGKPYYHGTDWPMKSKLQKQICTGCKKQLTVLK